MTGNQKDQNLHDILWTWFAEHLDKLYPDHDVKHSIEKNKKCLPIRPVLPVYQKFREKIYRRYDHTNHSN